MQLKSHKLLVDFMKHQKLSGRALAKKAGLKPAVVGHLVRDPKLPTARQTCSPVTAAAIEEALGCPSGMLFVAESSPVADSMRRRAA